MTQHLRNLFWQLLILVIVIFVLILIATPAYQDYTPSMRSRDRALALGTGAPTLVVASEETARVYNTEQYDVIRENPFLESLRYPISTFSLDVDTASYANVRRYLRDGSRPIPAAVRIEELINYFAYDYPAPAGDVPIAFTTELSVSPWNSQNRLLQVGIKAREVEIADIPPNNLVFLIDVSGSMMDANKLPLLKSAFKLLVSQLRAQDQVAMVVYAGAAGLVLPLTRGTDKRTIFKALEALNAGGSTAGGAGLRLAYEVARLGFDPNSNTRVILATDGDFNVGESSDAAMVRLIEKERDAGIFLSVLGFGRGNYKDAKMEKLADNGNGNYAYVDSLLEAKKVLVNEFGSTLLTVAKDVKAQIEFNPGKVQAYRLIGYENRLLSEEQFADDSRDAGDLGAGHMVTILYEIVPAGKPITGSRELAYQTVQVKDEAVTSPELATLRFRFKDPRASESRLLSQRIFDEPVPLESASPNFKFAAAVAEWGLLLRESKHMAQASFENVIELAREAKGSDPYGYRAEFIQLVELSQGL